MSILKRLLQVLGLSQPDTTREFNLDEDLRAVLYDLADLEKRTVDEIANDLIQQALDERLAASTTMRMWNQLTPRQQEITALVCLGYTNQQIAVRLNISPETVKSHVRAILRRFSLHSRTELSRLFANWDFKEWDR
jgi:DNA-binding NarL/FixJ family response regulator